MESDSDNIYGKGMYVDAKDTVNCWCVAEVLDVDNNYLKIHYEGWSEKYNEVNDLNPIFPI